MRWAGYLLILGILAVLNCVSPSVPGTAVMAAMIGTPLISWIMLLLGRKHCFLSMTAPATGAKGEQIPVEIHLERNRFSLPGRLELRLCMKNSITGQILRQKLIYEPGLVWEIRSVHCGCVCLELEQAKQYDPFGLLWVKIPVPKEKRIVVMPDTFPVLIDQVSYPVAADDCEEYDQGRKGQDRTETYQIRSYVPGDSLSQIHWKLSSKLDQMMVRDPGLPVDRNLMVFVDRSWGRVEAAYADALMEAAVSVAQSLSESGTPFRLAWNEDAIAMHDITDGDQLPGAVSALLKSELPSDTLAGTDIYLGLYGPVKMSRMIFIGNRLPENMDEFSGQTHTVSLLCAEGGTEEGIICFTPETREEALAQVSWS